VDQFTLDDADGKPAVSAQQDQRADTLDYRKRWVFSKPVVAATSGTLSTMTLVMPMMVTIRNNGALQTVAPQEVPKMYSGSSPANGKGA